MAQSLDFSKLKLMKRIGSPFFWLRIVWSIWFDAPWYQSNIHPKLKNADEAKWLLLQAVLGTMLISAVGLFGIWLVGQFIERIVPVYSGYMDFTVLIIMLCPLLFGAAGAIGSQMRDKSPASGISFAAGSAVLSLAWFVSMSAALAVLLLVPINPQFSASPFLAQWKISLTSIFPILMTFPSINGLMLIDQTTKSGPRETRFLGVLQKRVLRIIIGIGWVIMWALQGVTVMLSDWRYYPESFGNLWLVIGFIGAFFAFLYAMSISAWHRQVRTHLDIQLRRDLAGFA